jgi:hypothetical protein
MRHALKLHPDCRCDAVEGIEVEIGPRSGAQLRLRYVATGDMANLLVPAPAEPERTDGLWQSTCFEAFARQHGGDGYEEFNFSPSTQWAVYRFDGYRSGMGKPSVLAPRIEGRHGARHYELHVAFDLPGAGPWRLGLSAVIEETSGRKSYWALAHPAGKPDFHHADGFVLEVGA